MCSRTQGISSSQPRLAVHRGFRRVFDKLCAVASLITLPPAFCVIALAIKLDDGGPIFFTQQRVGKRLQLFRLLKFRTMIAGAERNGLLAASNYQRITRVGHFLRRHKLDELPQLINVLRGEMQLVGPRPEVSRYVEMFRPQFEKLLQEPPGLTDPASLTYIDESTHFSSAEFEKQYVSEILPDKLRLSLEYQRRRTLLSDIRIIFQTLLALFSRRHAPSFHHSYN